MGQEKKETKELINSTSLFTHYYWVDGVVVRIPAFHAGGRGFDSHIRQS